jgi:hypothetical protein
MDSDRYDGGPNTVINLACRIAQRGISVRLVSTAAPVDLDPAWFRQHAASLIGDRSFPEIEIVSAADPYHPLQVGPRDVFLATHWRTAQQLREVLALLPVKRFFYMLQDFEPSFYPWSSNYALAIETFDLDFWPIINEMTLAEYILGQPFGRLCEPVMRERALVFEPAVDTRLFSPGKNIGQRRPKRLLLYARPSNPRNVFGLALLALRRAAADPVFDGWEFLSIGSRDSVPDLAIGAGRTLRRASWMEYLGYADLLRESDLLLCPMLSPHTSYPVLEMAACGGISITNSFATKTRAQLERLSTNIISVEPTIEAFAEGLVKGAQRVNRGHVRTRSMDMPSSWGAALDPVALRVEGIIRGWVGHSDA